MPVRKKLPTDLNSLKPALNLLMNKTIIPRIHLFLVCVLETDREGDREIECDREAE